MIYSPSMNISSLYKLLQEKGYGVLGEYSGYRNTQLHIKKGKNEYMICVYKRERGIRTRIDRADEVMNLFKKELPVKQRLSIISQSPYIVMYTYLKGSTIPWEGYEMDHIKEIGKYMGIFHKLGKNRTTPSFKLTKEILHINEMWKEMNMYFQRSDVRKALSSKLNLKVALRSKQIERYISLLKKDRDTTILHMDFVRGNILFDRDKKVSGIIDFEKVSYGPRILDISRTLAFLLVDCKYKKEEKIRKYFLLSGYEKRGEYTLPNLKYLENLVNFFLLYDFFKFLYHTPYESLVLNEHFIRTRDRLLESKLLCPT